MEIFEPLLTWPGAFCTLLTVCFLGFCFAAAFEGPWVVHKHYHDEGGDGEAKDA